MKRRVTIHPSLDRATAWAAATDAANRSCWAEGRTCWNESDMAVAVAEFNRLWPESRDMEVIGT